MAVAMAAAGRELPSLLLLAASCAVGTSAKVPFSRGSLMPRCAVTNCCTFTKCSRSSPGTWIELKLVGVGRSSSCAQAKRVGSVENSRAVVL